MKRNKILDKSFFKRDTLDVAKDLLGKFLVKDGCVGQIYEVEAYIGNKDPACHAYKGITKRNENMFKDGGISYVYFIYGMYFCFNVVTDNKNRGCAVLIRGVKPIEGIDIMKRRRKVDNIENISNGPGKICQAFDIDRRHNGLNLCLSNNFFIEDRGFNVREIKKSKRIGINIGKEIEWRFTCEL